MESQNNSKVFGSIYTTRPKQDRHNQLLLPTSESHVKYENTHNTSGAPEFTSVFSGVRVTRSLVLCVCFVNRCLSFGPFSFGHCVVCSSSIYGF